VNCSLFRVVNWIIKVLEKTRLFLLTFRHFEHRGGSHRIFRGEDAPDGRWPFFVALRRVDGNDITCVSILTTDLLFTAAHCVPTDHDKLYATTRQSNGEPQGEYTDLSIRKYVAHEEYNQQTNEGNLTNFDPKLDKLFFRARHCTYKIGEAHQL